VVPGGDHGLEGDPDRSSSWGVGPFDRLRGEGRLRLLPETVRLSARRQKERGPLLNAARNAWLYLRWRLGASPEALYREYYR